MSTAKVDSVFRTRSLGTAASGMVLMMYIRMMTIVEFLSDADEIQYIFALKWAS